MISTQHNLKSAFTIHNHHKHNRYISADVCNSWIDKAQNSTQHGDYQTAMQVFEQAIFVNNITHIKLYNQFAKLLMDNVKNYTYAQKILNMALQLSLDTVSNVTDDMDELAHFYHNMGECYMFLNNYNESRLMFEKSI